MERRAGPDTSGRQRGDRVEMKGEGAGGREETRKRTTRKTPRRNKGYDGEVEEDEKNSGENENADGKERKKMRRTARRMETKIEFIERPEYKRGK